MTQPNHRDPWEEMMVGSHQAIEASKANITRLHMNSIKGSSSSSDANTSAASSLAGDADLTGGEDLPEDSNSTRGIDLPEGANLPGDADVLGDGDVAGAATSTRNENWPEDEYWTESEYWPEDKFWLEDEYWQEDENIPDASNISDYQDPTSDQVQVSDDWAVPKGPEPWLSRYRPQPQLPEAIREWLESERTLTPEEQQANQALASLQIRIANLPQELQDAILLQLIKLHLQPGKIVLEGCRCEAFELRDHRRSRTLCNARQHDVVYRNIHYEAYRGAYRNPDRNIFRSLDERWTQIALDVFYRGNTWILGASCRTYASRLHHVKSRATAQEEGQTHRRTKITCVELEMGCSEASFHIREQTDKDEGVLYVRADRMFTLAELDSLNGVIDTVGLNARMLFADDDDGITETEDIYGVEGVVEEVVGPSTGEGSRRRRLTEEEEKVRGYVEKHSRDGRALFVEKILDCDAEW